MKSFLPLAIISFWFANLGCNIEPPPEGMVLVSSGYFQMGTNRVDEDNQALSVGLKKPWFADETPERRIKLGSFYIDKFEVTNRQYYIYSQATDRPPPTQWQAMKYPEGQDDFPVTGVSFFDAAAYAQWARENVEAIVVAFIMALVIRCFCIEVFKIPSSSMEPTLMGDNYGEHYKSGCTFDHGRRTGGDRIMVTKFYYALAMMRGMKCGLTRRGPRSSSTAFCSMIPVMPPMPVAMIEP